MPSPLFYTPPSPDTIEEAAHHHLPPSPPLSNPSKSPRLSSVDRLLRYLRLCRAGRLSSASDWRTFPLSATEFADFDHRRQFDTTLSAWFRDKARYDFDSKGFTLRMPSIVHESFRVSVEGAIAAAISKHAARVEESAVKEKLKGIWQGGSADLKLSAPALENSSQDSQQGNIVYHCPDATFYSEDASLPSLVVEVSYSQQKKDLPRLADDYIVCSSHAIKCVVGLDIPYGKGEKDASVSVWRAGLDEDGVGFCRCDVGGEVFRTVDGEAAEGALELRLEDLVPWEMPESRLVGQDTISIPFSDLAAYLTAARKRATPRAPAKATSQPTKFRKRKRTPEEELSPGREDECVRLETAAEERSQAKDGGWRARSRRRAEVVDIPVRRNTRSARGHGGEAA